MVLGVPTNKCQHGVYKGRSTVAMYCSFCNPNMKLAVIPSGAAELFNKHREELKEALDVADFMSRPMGLRLSMGGAEG